MTDVKWVKIESGEYRSECGNARVIKTNVGRWGYIVGNQSGMYRTFRDCKQFAAHALWVQQLVALREQQVRDRYPNVVAFNATVETQRAAPQDMTGWHEDFGDEPSIEERSEEDAAKRNGQEICTCEVRHHTTTERYDDPC
jgi:hypothetical protein